VKLGHDDKACKTLFKKQVFPKFFNPLALVPFSLSSDKLRNEFEIIGASTRRIAIKRSPFSFLEVEEGQPLTKLGNIFLRKYSYFEEVEWLKEEWNQESQQTQQNQKSPSFSIGSSVVAAQTVQLICAYVSYANSIEVNIYQMNRRTYN
jgi:hypothetical protein